MVYQEDKSEVVDVNGSAKLAEEDATTDLPNEEATFGGTDVGEPRKEAENETGAAEETTPLYSPVRRLSEIAEELYKSGETACGLWCFGGRWLQGFANKKAYVILYGVLGSVMAASYSYLNGTITTLEKRFKIPSTNTGIILVGGDISQLVLCLILNYYGGRGHRPRWIAFGVYTVVAFCLMNALPHFLYGPGADALDLTLEYGSHDDENSTAILIDAQNRKVLCQKEEVGCEDNSDVFAPQVILFMAQLVSGVGGSLYYSLGISYMDDNVKKSKSPALASFSFFLRTLGPAAGYTLASVCLRLYISPDLTPTIGHKDPRWLGAWWLGWLIVGGILFVFATIVAMFPRSLPRAAARRVLAEERRKAGLAAEDEDDKKVEPPTSFHDMSVTVKRLIKNKTLMCNSFASVFYLMGYMPYWVFLPKYIETIYKQTASASSLITGTLGLVFSAIGILASGLFISKAKPSARFLAAWNIVVGIISVLGIISYSFLDCPVNDRQGVMLESGQLETNTPCNMDCHCNYVKYSPVCSPDGRTFISPCHAGCKNYEILPNGTKVFMDCSCVPPPPESFALTSTNLSMAITAAPGAGDSWRIKEGPCPVDCTTNFYIFLFIVCTLKFNGATGRTSNFLVSIRCVDEKDKAAAMGLGLMFMSLFAFIPSPILFGYFIDKTCMVWGKTCTGTGNCWLYNGEMLRYLMNYTAACFVSVGTFFDFGVWYYVKNLKIFDDEVEMEFSPQRAKTQKK